MHIFSQFIFVLLLASAIFLFTKNCRNIRRNILLGRDEDLSDQKTKRWRNVILLAIGQKKMFRNPLVAVLHIFVYAGFIIVNIELIEIILDGILGCHRLFAGIGALYVFLINAFEVVAFIVLLTCLIFLVRRNIIHVKRLSGKDLKGFPRTDANAILISEVILMSLFLIMNCSDTLLTARGVDEYANTPATHFVISSFLQPLFDGLSSPSLIIIERSAWWLHIVGILAFLNYLPYSKHLHVMLAFPNAYYTSLKPKGEMENMPEIQQEVLYAMQPESAPAEPSEAEHKNFGAKDVFDLSWKNLLDAYTCAECGRCSAACPASITGKLLSPRMIVMKTRDRLEEVGRNISKHRQFADDGKSLLHDYISEEELNACNACFACVEECPVSISPLDIILQMRRYLIMEESNAPQEWNAMFANIENNFAAWQFPPTERFKWAED